MADNFREQLDEDIANVFLNEDEFAAEVTITDLSGGTVTTSAQFTFEIGAVDNKERAVFRVADSLTVARNYYVTFLGERWTVVDIRPDDLGMLELKCDRAEVTS